jgi:hypothetical protein
MACPCRQKQSYNPDYGFVTESPCSTKRNNAHKEGFEGMPMAVSAHLDIVQNNQHKEDRDND